MKPLFQILYYQVIHVSKNMPLHILNGLAIFEHYPSPELVAAFNRQCCSVSFKTIKIMRSDIAKYIILKSKDDNVPLPNQFNALFTIAAFENFGNRDRNTLSGMCMCMTLLLQYFK